MGYNDNEQSRQFSLWMTRKGHQNRVKAVKQEMAERIEMRKQEERQRQIDIERERRRQRNKSHQVQIDLTRKQEEELLSHMDWHHDVVRPFGPSSTFGA